MYLASALFEKRIRQYIGISCSILYTRDMEKA